MNWKKIFKWESKKDKLIKELQLKVSALEKENEYLQQKLNSRRDARKRKTGKTNSKA